MLRYRTVALTSFALLAFAGNSVLTRLALADGVSDPVSFTMIRLISGAVALVIIVWMSSGLPSARQVLVQCVQGRWSSAVYLLAYALLFSIAYTQLATGIGALILFGTVQITMIGDAVLRGRRLALIEIVGALIALGGVVYLLWPAADVTSGLSSATPMSWLAGLLMLISGIAWGMYSLAGASSDQAMVNTAVNFLRTVPLLVLLTPLFLVFTPVISIDGVVLAIASGAITSGMGYAIWYAVLPYLAATQAAVVQLLVPVIAAVGGVMVVQEAITVELFVSSLLVLGGVLLVATYRSPPPRD